MLEKKKKLFFCASFFCLLNSIEEKYMLMNLLNFLGLFSYKNTQQLQILLEE